MADNALKFSLDGGDVTISFGPPFAFGAGGAFGGFGGASIAFLFVRDVWGGIFPLHSL